MSTLIRLRRRMLALLCASLLLLVACHLTKEEEVVQVFTFQTLADSLQGTDSALIVLIDRAGKPIDTLFYGPVGGATFSNLESKHYRGGPVTIMVEGFKGGKLVYKLQKEYSGESGKDTTLVIVARPVVRNVKVDSVRIQPESLSLNAKGPEGILKAIVDPDSASQLVTWQSLEPANATVSSQGRVSGLDTGRARIVAWSVADGKVSDTIWVTITAPLKVEKVAFDRASLEVYVGGSAESLKVTVLPPGADPRVRLTSENPAVASLENGKVKGLQEGETRVHAVSLEDTTLSAVLRVLVHPKPADPVDSVTVSPDTLRLYTGGEALPLSASIHPRTLKPQFAWHSAAPGIAQVDAAGKVTPISAGRTYIRARSLVDSTKGDSALTLVKKDVPRIALGIDTTISVGAAIIHSPTVSQEYGTLVEVRWDLDGNGSWDDTATAFRPISQAYPEAKEYIARFYAKDSEGNDTVATRKVRSVNGPVILFKSPADGAYVNSSPLLVTWTVDGVEQSASEALKPGPNTITRNAKNAAGETFSASITVHFDSDPPARPIVKGPASPTSSLRPAWSWESAGGGNGTFRYRLNLDNFTTGAALGTDTAFTPAANLVGGTHTLYVQERDQAGNWSPSGSFAVRIDTSAPAAPVVNGTTPSPTNNRRPAWSWTGSASEGLSSYRFKLDNADLRTGATSTSSLTFTVPAGSELSEGPHTLYVQQADSAGNWSSSGSAQIVVDLTPPLAPRVTAPSSPTNDRTPTWTFAPRGGGNGTYRFKLNDRDLSSGATETATPSFTPSQDLAAGRQTLHVHERDSAGNWSPSDSASVTIDLSTPGAPSVNLLNGSPTNNQTPTWTWRSATGGTGNFRYKFNDPNLFVGATETRDTTYHHTSNLNEGTYALYVQEKNSAGTWSTSGFKQVRIDLTKPIAPTVSLVQTSPTNERRPTWNWTHTEPGAGWYRYSLDNAAFRDTNSTGFRPAANLSEASHTLRIQERDSAGNWSDIAYATIIIDVTGPAVPVFNLSQPRSPVASLRPVWSWSTGGGGNGNRYRISLDNAAFQEIVGTSFQPSFDLTEGTHTLRLQELDEAGNPSGIVGRTIVSVSRGYLGKPNFTNDQPSNISFVTRGTDTAIAAFTISGALKAQRFQNGTWGDLGTGLFNGTCHEMQVGVSRAGIPYIAYMDQGNGSRLGVMRLNGSSWQNVGSSLVSPGWDNKPQIFFSPTDVPFVMYESGSQLNTPVVARYTGTLWESLGQNGLVPYGMDDYALAFHKNGDPVMAFASFEDKRLAVVRYSYGRGTWDTVGNIVALDKYTDALDLLVNDNDEAMVAFLDQSTSLPTVLKQSGNQWNALSSTGMPAGEWGDMGLALGANQQPMLAFKNKIEVGRACVMAFNGSSWQPVGPAALSEGGAIMISLKTNSNGVPFMAFKDASNAHGFSVIKTGFDP